MSQSNVNRRSKGIKRIVVLLVVAIIVFIGGRFLVNNSLYNEAMDLYESGEYKESIETFELLGDYLDSEEMILEANYNIGTNLLDEKKYDQAINLFTSLDGFKDSDDLINRCIYSKAKAYAKNDIWSLAIDTISSIPGYLDSDELKRNYTYNYALEKAESEEWETAINIIEPLGNYLRSQTLIKEYTYNLALEKYKDNDQQSALDLLSTIKDFKDGESLSYQIIINDALKIDPIFPTTIITKEVPTSTEDFEQVLLYMVYEKDYSVDFSIDSYNKEILSEVYENLDTASWVTQSKYVESYSHFLIYDTLGTGIFGLRISDEHQYEKFKLESYKVIMDLIKEGRLIADMSQKEIARELFIWVAQNLRYDYDFEPASYTGYGALINRKAVCNGYTALYNMLCKIVGIEVVGVLGDVEDPDDHIWTLANLDGQEVYIDTTWGDPSSLDDNTYDLKYFAVDEGFMSLSRTWDRDVYILD